MELVGLNCPKDIFSFFSVIRLVMLSKSRSVGSR